MAVTNMVLTAELGAGRPLPIAVADNWAITAGGAAVTAVAPKSGDDGQVVLTTATTTYTIRANDFARVLQANLPSAGASRPFASNTWVGYLLAALSNSGVALSTSMASAARYIDN